MSGRATKGGVCVLVVDDEEDIRETLREAIELVGCTAAGAANGAEAMAFLEAERPCLVILDLLMPVMTGLETIAAMRRDPALRELSVLVSSSAPSRAPAGVPVLPKPIDIQRLWSHVRESCRCGSARRHTRERGLHPPLATEGPAPAGERDAR
ncbi:MAG: response regulator [Labilithrix sp.]|nr:response regulator [Labilithrix sp.]